MRKRNFSLNYLNWFRDLSWGLEKHTTCATKVFFLPLFSRNFDDQLSSNLHRFVILCIIRWDTPSEKTGLWKLPKESSAFKRKKVKKKRKISTSSVLRKSVAIVKNHQPLVLSLYKSTASWGSNWTFVKSKIITLEIVLQWYPATFFK